MRPASNSRVLHHTITTLAALATMSSVNTAEGQARATGEASGKTKPSGQYADVNGIKLYYEIHGAGRPLVLLHGGLGAIEMFAPNLPALAKGHQVIEAYNADAGREWLNALLRQVQDRLNRL